MLPPPPPQKNRIRSRSGHVHDLSGCLGGLYVGYIKIVRRTKSWNSSETGRALNLSQENKIEIDQYWRFRCTIDYLEVCQKCNCEN